MEDTDDDEQKPQYCATFRTGAPYMDDNNYMGTRWSDLETLKSDTIEGLCERMACVRVQHTLRADNDPDARREWGRTTWADLYEIEFSEITREVCPFDEDKLKATETWKKLGEAREAHRAKMKAEEERELKRRQDLFVKNREEREREEYDRLCKKYGGT